MATLCVISPNKVLPTGYASCHAIRFGVRIQAHHRLAWIDAHGRLPAPGMIICHTRMPGGHPKNCVNPDHLYEGTPADNIADAIADGVHVGAAEQCPNGHPYDEANTYWTRTGRCCRACRRARSAAFAAAHPERQKVYQDRHREKKNARARARYWAKKAVS